MRGMVDGLANPFPLAFSMPTPYQGDSFTERFLSVFDDILAPVLTTLDTFDAYLDPSLTPPDFLPWLANWVGIEIDENWSEEQQRRLIATAIELLQWRGTRRGTIDLIHRFLGIDADRIEVVDSGGVSWSVTPGGPVPGTTPATLTVRVEVADPDAVDARRLEQLIAMSEPAHVASKVEVVAVSAPKARAPKKRAEKRPDEESDGDADPPAADHGSDES